MPIEQKAFQKVLQLWSDVEQEGDEGLSEE